MTEVTCRLQVVTQFFGLESIPVNCLELAPRLRDLSDDEWTMGCKEIAADFNSREEQMNLFQSRPKAMKWLMRWVETGSMWPDDGFD